jgi:Peptidase A4 family
MCFRADAMLEGAWTGAEPEADVSHGSTIGRTFVATTAAGVESGRLPRRAPFQVTVVPSGSMVTSRDWLRPSIVVVCAALAGLGLASAQTLRAAAGAAQSAVAISAAASNPVISPNWSGYVATGRPGSPVSYSSVTGTWTEPTVTCARGDSGSFSTIAVGLGGFGANAQSDEQVGADANCGASGKPAYYAWFDLAPYPSYSVPHKVRPGDTLTATVSIISTKRPPWVEVQVENVTRNWTFTREISWVSAGQFLVAPGAQNTGGQSTPDTSSAEWLVEAPSSCHAFTCAQASLANFSSVSMTKISAVANGSSGTLTDSDWKVTRLRLVPGQVRVPSYPQATPFARDPAQKGIAASPAGANPGGTSTDGHAFKVKWVAVAKGVV